MARSTPADEQQATVEDLAEGEIGADEDVPLGEALQCPECGRRFKNAIGLGLHRRNAHNVLGRVAAEEASGQRKPRKKRSTAAGAKGAEINRLRRQLKQSVQALTLLPFMAKGTASNLNDPRIVETIDAKADAFADAWIAVAEQNEIVRRNLAMLLSSGVWLNAAAQTAALGYVVAVFSQTIPMHPGAMMLLPEMSQFFTAPTAPANGKPAAEEAAPVGDQGA